MFQYLYFFFVFPLYFFFSLRLRDVCVYPVSHLARTFFQILADQVAKRHTAMRCSDVMALFKPQRPRLNLKLGEQPKPSLYSRSRKTLQFKDKDFEHKYKKAYSEYARRTARHLGYLMILIGIAAMLSALIGLVQNSSNNDNHGIDILLRGMMTIIPVPLLFMRNNAFIVVQVYALFCIFMYYAFGFSAILLAGVESHCQPVPA